MNGAPEAREAGERRKPTVPPCGMGKVRSKRNKPAKRARNLAAFSVARFADSGVSTFGAALGRWHRGAVPRIIAGGEGRWFSGPNPRIKAKEKCAATAAREGAASVILRGPAGARSMVLLVPGVAGRKNGGPNPRIKAKEKCAATAAREGAASVILRGPARIRACRGAVDGNAGSGGCGPQERRPSPPARILCPAPRRQM